MVSSLSFAFGVAAALAPSAALAAKQFAIQPNTPAASQAASPDEVSSNVLTLTKSKSASKSSGYLSSIRKGAGSNGRYQYGATPIDNLYSEEYITEIQWAGISVEVIVDTGSSDTWLVQKGFTCVNINGTVVPEADCYFGPVFNGTFEEGEIKGENFNISYGDGEFLSGFVGYEDVTVAGITVKHQEVALVDYAYWEGDGVSSGLMGLAYPLLTSAFKGTNPTQDSLANQVEYNPVFTSMWEEGLVKPVFSLACERNSDSGYLALGGLPPVAYTPTFSSTPILKLDIVNWPASETQYTFYTIVADNYIFEGSEKIKPSTGAWGEMFPEAVTNSSQFPAIVDSGTTLLYLPTGLADAILALYSPPPIYIADQGATFAPCNAKTPSLGVTIGGQTFWISPADMLMQTASVEVDGVNYCLTGPQDGGDEGPYVLGDTFLNNVVAVFDIGASEMRFAPHENY